MCYMFRKLYVHKICKIIICQINKLRFLRLIGLPFEATKMHLEFYMAFTVQVPLERHVESHLISLLAI